MLSIIFASFNFSIKKKKGEIPRINPRPKDVHYSISTPSNSFILHEKNFEDQSPRTVGSSSPASAPSNFFASPNEKKREREKKNSKDQSLKKNYSHPVYAI